MSYATKLGAAFEDALGPADDTIHTAIPPMDLGGGADVITFRRAPGIDGVVHVSAGLAVHASAELAICTRAPSGWAPSFLSRLAAAARQRRFVWNGTTPLGGDAPFAGLLFTHVPRAYPQTVEERYLKLMLCIGITAAELAACRSHGTPSVVALLQRARVFPFSELERGDVAGVSALGSSPLERTGLSERARRGLAAVVNGQSEQVESLRTTFPRADLEILASTYGDLVAFEQRCELVKLTQDAQDPCLVPMWRALAGDALAHAIEANTGEHVALAAALCGLDGTTAGFDAYWDDLDAALAKARAHASP